jgi:hypothetical protein
MGRRRWRWSTSVGAQRVRLGGVSLAAWLHHHRSIFLAYGRCKLRTISSLPVLSTTLLALFLDVLFAFVESSSCAPIFYLYGSISYQSRTTYAIHTLTYLVITAGEHIAYLFRYHTERSHSNFLSRVSQVDCDRGDSTRWSESPVHRDGWLAGTAGDRNMKGYPRR